MSRSRDLVRVEVQPVTFRSRFVTYGPFAISLYLLATSKWGSYLPFTVPPFVTDMVFGLLAANYVLFTRHERQSEDGTPTRFLIAGFLCLCSADLLRGSLSLTAFRDAAPYFYALLALITVPPLDVDRERVDLWVDIALGFHTAWVALAVAVPSIYQRLPLLAGQINILGPRNDFDGAVCGIYAAYCFHRALCGRRIFLNVGLALVNAALLLFLRERAGLLAFLVALLVVTLLGSRRRLITRADRAQGLIPVLILCFPLIIVVGSQTPAYQRLLASVHTVVPFVHASPKYATDTATQSNREKAWRRVITWQDASLSKEVFGVGFGPNFMHESGADILLLGGPSTDVRSPHDYFVGTWARLGLIGLGVVTAILLCGLWLAVLVHRRARPLLDVDVLAMLIIAGIPAAASVGVILESPFGAVPYFWALGHLRARSVRLRPRGLAKGTG